MSLSDHAVSAVMATADMDKARDFYEGKLKLPVESDNTPEGPVTYACGEGSVISVYLSPEHAGKSTATMAAWAVEDVEALVDELSANGVSFERYDQPELQTNEKGIVEGDGFKIAFMRDPDGNTHALNGS